MASSINYFGAFLSSSRRRRRRPKEQHHEGTKHTCMEKNTEETRTTLHLLVLTPKRKSHTHRYMWLPLRGLLSFGARRLSRSDWDPSPTLQGEAACWIQIRVCRIRILRPARPHAADPIIDRHFSGQICHISRQIASKSSILTRYQPQTPEYDPA